MFTGVDRLVGRSTFRVDMDELRISFQFSQLVQPYVSQNPEEPTLNIAIRTEPVHRRNGAKISLLYQVLCVCLVAGSNHGVIVQRA